MDNYTGGTSYAVFQLLWTGVGYGNGGILYGHEVTNYHDFNRIVYIDAGRLKNKKF